MSDSAAENRLAIYSDYVCPFCYLGRASLREYQERDDTTATPPVEWRFFDLRGSKRGPDGSIDHEIDNGKDDDYFAQVRENVQRLKEKYDVEMAMDFSRDVDSWDAQQAALYVKQSYGTETFREFHNAVFDALWQDGRDIGDVDVLAAIADEVGIDPEEIRSAVDDETLEAELRDRFAEAQERGISGIPTFVYDGYAARGAVPPEHLQRLVEG